MVQARIDSVLNDLEYLEKNLFSHIADQVQTLKVELRFLRTFLTYAEWRNIASNNVNFCKILKIVEDELIKAGKDFTAIRRTGVHGIIHLTSGSSYRLVDSNTVVRDLLKKLEVFKPDIREVYLDLSNYLSPVSDEFFFKELIGSILKNLKDLYGSDGNLIVSIKDEIMALAEKLIFMGHVAAFAEKRCSEHKSLEDLLSQIEAVVDAAAPLAYLCWLSREDTSMFCKMEDMLSDTLQKVKLSTPKAIEMYVGILKASVTSRSDIYLAGEIVVSFVNILLGNLLHLAKDQIGPLREGLVLMMAMVMEPAEGQTEDEKLILLQSEAVVSEAAACICSFQANKKKDKVTANRDPAISLLEKIELVKTEAIEIHPELSEVPPFNFPRIDGLGFTCFLLENLRKLLKCKAFSVAFVKHQIETIMGELEFFKSFLMDTVEERNLYKELKALEIHVTGGAYEAQYVIESFLMGDRPVWYYILQLFNVMRAIQLIKGKVVAIYDEHSRRVSVENGSKISDYISSEANPPKIDEVVVGFHDEAQTIIERLTRGSPKRDIIAIVGMPGLGKTTLAKKIYDEPSITCHFHIRAWCFVSHVYEKKNLLLTILSQIIDPTDKINDKIYDKSTDVLDELLRKCLKRNKYLIVMDDLWKIEAWDDLKYSFPDDNNGSRILFTSRNCDEVLKAKSDCNPHSLRLLSDDESWELLEKIVFKPEECPKQALEEKTFLQKGFPEELLKLGRKIAENCKGLPLSIVVIAGLLAKTEKTQEWWRFVAERLSSERVGGTIPYRDILNLSYKHLPNHLKPCFLYFGAFPEDEEIPVSKLVWLWIAEGFVRKTELKSLEDMAEDYLMDLVSRSLVIVAKRRSKGGVKTCRIHDVLHDFCVEKAKEENFLQLKWGSEDDYGGGGGGDGAGDHENDDDNQYDKRDMDGTDSSATYEVRRVGIYYNWEQFTTSAPFGPRVRSLLFFATSHTDLLSDPYPDTGIFYKFKLLNVLDLGCINIGDTFPHEIELLVHLRFLSVRGRMGSIPPSIVALWNLETFIVKGLRGEVKLPDTIWDMVALRHLHVNNRVAFILEDHELEDTRRLENLVSVSTLYLGHGRSTKRILRGLTNVRKLKCIFSESWNRVGNCNGFPVLNSLSQLESLKLLYHGMVRSSCEFSFPSNLKKLSLSKFRLPWEGMHIIGRLPNLVVLKLLFRAFEGPEWNTRKGEFLKLEFLKLDDLAIKQWNASADHFPRLRQLVLQRCKQLEKIPSGLGDITTLEMIEVQWCSISASKSARHIQEEQQDDALKVFIYLPDQSSSS